MIRPTFNSSVSTMRRTALEGALDMAKLSALPLLSINERSAGVSMQRIFISKLRNSFESSKMELCSQSGCWVHSGVPEVYLSIGADNLVLKLT